VRDSGNAKIEQHFHGHPSPPIITVPPQQPEEIKPRIIFLAVKKINATLDTGIYETNEKGDADCIKACFRNEVEYEKPTKDATGVKAHVRLMDSDGAEIGEGFSGLQWLGDNVGDEIDIAKSESACVCIFIINRSDKRWFVPVWKKVYGGFVDDTQTLSHVPATAEIKLSNRKGLLLPPVLIDIKIDGDAISVTPRKTK
jgi:hypothetical protein